MPKIGSTIHYWFKYDQYYTFDALMAALQYDNDKIDTSVLHNVAMSISNDYHGRPANKPIYYMFTLNANSGWHSNNVTFLNNNVTFTACASYFPGGAFHQYATILASKNCLHINVDSVDDVLQTRHGDNQIIIPYADPDAISRSIKLLTENTKFILNAHAKKHNSWADERSKRNSR